jgi:outer membrane protein assembly factor BamB
VFSVTAGAAVADGNFLFSCGDGEVVQYDPDNPNEGELVGSVNI